MVVFVEELLTKMIKIGLLMLLEQDVRLTVIVRERCLFVKKERVP